MILDKSEESSEYECKHHDNYKSHRNDKLSFISFFRFSSFFANFHWGTLKKSSKRARIEQKIRIHSMNIRILLAVNEFKFSMNFILNLN